MLNLLYLLFSRLPFHLRQISGNGQAALKAGSPMVLNRTSAGDSAAYGLLFFSLACYCFLDLHIVSLNRYQFYIYQRRGLMFDV